ncbi:hypothetical protein BKA62DRAFT_721080 [Auriculariales sp. MPI-PUGE-AT-0066]|nr:hypothetical protein BKA62DRAFT_721080 [Auriculariales sp. MPI-PUGE-AT-0066]
MLEAGVHKVSELWERDPSSGIAQVADVLDEARQRARNLAQDLNELVEAEGEVNGHPKHPCALIMPASTSSGTDGSSLRSRSTVGSEFEIIPPPRTAVQSSGIAKTLAGAPTGDLQPLNAPLTKPTILSAQARRTSGTFLQGTSAPGPLTMRHSFPASGVWTIVDDSGVDDSPGTRQSCPAVVSPTRDAPHQVLPPIEDVDEEYGREVTAVAITGISSDSRRTQARSRGGRGKRGKGSSLEFSSTS